MTTSRYVPLSIKLKCILGRGLVIAAFWILTVEGIALRFILPQTDVLEPIYFAGELEKVETTILEVVKTNVSVGGSKNSPGAPVYEYRYRYSAGGVDYEGSSFSSSFGGSQGQKVFVEYPVSSPGRSRIVGLGRGMIHWAVGWGMLATWPVGLILLLLGLKKGLKTARLLQDGVLAKAKLVGQRATGVMINNSPVIEYTFEFTARDGRKYNVSEKTHQGGSLMDDKEEDLLYDPENPALATLTDNLPGKPKVDQAGDLHGSGGFTSLIPAIICALTYYLCFFTDKVTF
jgi:hypothetical protein